MTRRDWLLISALTLVGALLRVYQIGTQSLWLDELLSVIYARGDWANVLSSTAQGDTNPPLFNLLLNMVLRFGSNEVAARAVSALFSIGTIPMFFLMARRLFNNRVATAATLMLVFNPFHILFAQEARMYAVFTFFTAASVYFFLCAWQTNRTWDWIFLGLLQVFAFYSHSLAFLNLFAMDVFAAIQWGRMRQRLRGLGLAHVQVAVLFFPWALVLVQQAARVGSGFWGSAPSAVSLLTVPFLFLFSNNLMPVLVAFALFASLALLVFALVASFRTIRLSHPDAPNILFAWIIFIVPIVTLFLISYFRPLFVERTLLPASLGLYLVFAWTIVSAKPRVLHAILAVLVFIGMVIALSNYYFNPDMQKPPMRDAARALVSQVQAGDVVAHTSDSSALAFEYYAPLLNSHFLAGDPDYTNVTTRGRSGIVAGLVPEEWNAIANGHSRLWLVVALDHNVEYQKSQVNLADLRLTRIDQKNIGGIDLLLYQVAR